MGARSQGKGVAKMWGPLAGEGHSEDGSLGLRRATHLLQLLSSSRPAVDWMTDWRARSRGLQAIPACGRGLALGLERRPAIWTRGRIARGSARLSRGFRCALVW